MIVLKHAVGLFSHPAEEWAVIREERCTVGKCYLSYLLILAAIPAVSMFIGTTQVGWQVGYGPAVKLTSSSAMLIAVAFYFAMLSAVYVMGRLIHWMASTYGAKPNPEKCVVLAAYTATPLFLVGIMGLYPTLWLDMLIGLVGVGYAIYLLYTGMPVVMQITKEQAFLLSSAVLTVGLVMLVGLLTVTVLLWGFGLGPDYVT